MTSAAFDMARIVSAEIYLTENELNNPYHVSIGTITHIKAIVLKLTDADGVVGWGEANPLTGFTDETHDETIEVLRNEYLPLVRAEPNPEPAVIGRLLKEHRSDHLFGKAAIAMALLDIKGKRLSVSVAEFLGGAIRSSLDVLWPLSDQTPEEDIALIDGKIKEGYNTFMLKMGSPPVDIDASINRVRTLENYYAGHYVKLICDANRGWTFDQSVKFLDGIKGVKLVIFVEQPVGKDDIGDMAKLTASTDLAISADESLSSFERAEEIIERRAANIFSIKSSKNGGPLDAQAIGLLAQDNGIKCWMNSMPELGISQAASLQHALTMTNLVDAGHAYMSTLRLRGDPTNFGSFVRNGVVRMPPAPGLGIEVDEEQLRRITILHFMA